MTPTFSIYHQHQLFRPIIRQNSFILLGCDDLSINLNGFMFTALKEVLQVQEIQIGCARIDHDAHDWHARAKVSLGVQDNQSLLTAAYMPGRAYLQACK